MKSIRYVSNTGEILDLLKPPYMLQTGEIFDQKWEYESNGGKIARFFKTIEERPLVLSILNYGKQEYYKAIDHFEEVTEEDLIHKTPGRLYFGESYFSCYVTASKKSEWENDIELLDTEVTIVSDHPYWVREHRYSFRKNESDPEGAKRYANRYPYRYANGLTNSRIVNDHYADSNFLLTIYGPIVDPVLYIGGHEYSVKIVLEEGEYLEIDSAAGTVVKVKASGERVNAFHNRSFEISVFEPIHPGGQDIGWSGRFAFDLVIYEERSEPRWR